MFQWLRFWAILAILAIACGKPFPCEDFKLQMRRQNLTEIQLHPRISPAKVVDSFSFGFEYEMEELLLRFYEMGPEVDEFHVVEGDHDFQGDPKPFRFQTVLDSGVLDQWKEKIIHHKVQVPKGIIGYKLQRYMRAAMKAQMHNFTKYPPTDVLLEGDLDEIVSRRALKLLKNCATDNGQWKTSIEMGYFWYSMAWWKGLWGMPTVAASFLEWQTGIWPSFIQSDDMTGVTHGAARLGSVYLRPNLLSARDNTLIGWHLSFMLNGSKGLAHKIWIMVEKRPWFARNFTTEVELANFLENKFLNDPRQYDDTISRFNSKTTLPEALLEHADLFPHILRSVTLSAL